MIYEHSADLKHRVICKIKAVITIRNYLKFIKNYMNSVTLQVVNVVNYYF